jgi:undecaprenyl-diphosphatase
VRAPHEALSLRVWRGITHCGGVTASVSAALVPLVLSAPGSALRLAAAQAAVALSVSHLATELVKRRVGRPRPSRSTGLASLVYEPGCFSFPSGHATSSMAVAIAYAIALPNSAALLPLFAMAIGFSRVRLGVHYPGDVLAGQIIAITTAVAVWVLW